MGAEYCDQRVWLFVCLSAVISQEAQAQTVTNFRGVLPVAWLGRPLVALRYDMHFRFCR